MPLPVIDDTTRVAVQGVCPNGQPWVNVLHFQNADAAPRATHEAEIITNLQNIYSAGGVSGTGTSGWATIAGAGAAVQKVTMTPLDGASASTEYSLPIAGAASGDALPSDVALVCTLRTQTRGRSFRGRSYWAGITEGNNTVAGKLSPVNQGEIIANWVGVVAAALAAGSPLVVASYKLEIAVLVTSVTVNDVFDRQTRRRS